MSALVFAAKNGHQDIVEMLLGKGETIEDLSMVKGFWKLYLSIRLYKILILSLMYAYKAFNYTASKGNKNLADLLLSKGATIHYQSEVGLCK